MIACLPPPAFDAFGCALAPIYRPRPTWPLHRTIFAGGHLWKVTVAP